MEIPAASTDSQSPIATHRCTRSGPQNCDALGACSSSWSCHKASCKRCVDLNWNLYCHPTYGKPYAQLPLPYVQIQTTLKNITLSAKHGCQICSLLCEGITAVSRSLIDKDASYSELLANSTLVIELRHNGPVMVRLCAHNDEDTTYLLVEFYTRQDTLKTCPELNMRNLTAFARKHMDDCTKRHPICSSNTSKVRPTRIIDVGLEAPLQNIFLTTLPDERAQYVTLSHCWGDTSTILTTTKRTIDQRRRNIPFSELPKTFQDAVQITRALGFRYLWIDSLCIIQDDKDDWQFESAKMAEIYLESCLTIAATASVDANGGFFFGRWTSQPGGIKSNIETFEFPQTFSGANFTMYCRQGLDSGHQRMSGYASASTNTAPLLHRAWAYQERILAPRMLHVHTEEMFWECKSCTVCECGYLSWERDHLDCNKWSLNGRDLSLKGRVARAVDEATRFEDAHTLWLDVVEEYSMLAITKESDRLPALSGLAKFLSHKVSTPYLAGLWESNLAIGLLWRRCSVLYSSCSRDKLSHIPSWSWASVVRASQSDGETNQLNHITYDEVRDGILQDPRLKILNATCKVTNTNPFGEVSGGKISIEGALIIAKYTTPLHLSRPQVLFGTEASGVHLDIWGAGEPAEVLDGEMVFCLLFGLSTYDYASHALVLKAVGANTYRRVGYLNLVSKLRWFDDVIPFVVNII